jgi:hypothetical protein
MENTNFPQNKGGTSFLSIALLQYVSILTDNCKCGLQILTKTLLDLSEYPLFLSDFNRNRKCEQSLVQTHNVYANANHLTFFHVSHTKTCTCGKAN